MSNYPVRYRERQLITADLLRAEQQSRIDALQRAFELGCEQVFTCTGVSVPGDPQHSYNNILRAGFHETYVRANYAPG